MSFNQTPTGERIHIGIFGKRNAGKSSLINAITNQDIAIVSEIKGTTTDPVQKAMELPPLGPVVIIDTPGLDDTKELGELRIQKAVQVLNKTDIALLVVDISCGLSSEDMEILERIQKKQIPCIIVFNKMDLSKYVDCEAQLKKDQSKPTDILNIKVSAVTGANIEELKELIGTIIPVKSVKYPLVQDLLSPGDNVILVIPIDEGAPKGRLILPQQQVIRDILEVGANGVVVRATQLEEALKTFNKAPVLVITDSQIFEEVDKVVPSDILLTSFSVLFARYKGVLKTAVQGAFILKDLKEGDKVLISEGCTHHRQCNDIGTVKLPRWVEDYTGQRLDYEFTSGTEFPNNLSEYKCIIHCGGCMLSEREMRWRMTSAKEQGIPFTNYGIAIAQIHGILERSIEPFKIK
jgi:[FeFe] hydrogenase H-cluster maturation GTPase HydF